MDIPTIIRLYEGVIGGVIAMQRLSDIEKAYEVRDPWGFQSNPEDEKRKRRILEIATQYRPIMLFYDRALDIGAGEGWITKDLPARKKYGYEVSTHAKKRFPSDVMDYEGGEKGHGGNQFDLITACGVLYSHYDYRHFIRMINTHASNVIITCNIKDWEINLKANPIEATQVHMEEFTYREYVQTLRVFKK